MIQGRFGDENELFFEIELITADCLELSVEAMLDTGFSGWLAIDSQDLEGFNWIYLGTMNMQMAKGGEVEFSLYEGSVKLNGNYETIIVHVTEGINEILLGRKWLENRKLVVDISAKLLSLETIKS